MKTFKIRDLMIALRPTIGTPQRPKPFDCCLPSACEDGISIEPFDDTGGCDCTDADTCVCTDGDTCDCTDGDTCDCTDGDTCGCTDACTDLDSGGCGAGDSGCHAECTYPCTIACTHPCTAACTFVCTAECTFECTGECTFPCTFACTGRCTQECTFCTETCRGGCSECGITLCGSGCTMTERCGDRVSHPPPERLVAQMAPTELAHLKTQLRATMAQVKERDKALAADAEKKALAPKTVEQVDALEKLLSGALEELRRRRAELEKAKAPKGRRPKQGGKKR